MDNMPQESQMTCAECGAPVAAGASACAQCGAPLAPVPQQHVASAPVPVAPAAQPANTAASATNPAAASEPRRCSWCGEMSPAGVEQCAHCGAVFPKPELDEAYLRAAEERLAAANDTLAMLQRRRARRGLGRFFGR